MTGEPAGPPPLGPDPRLASALAYVAWWVSGGLVWLIERDRPRVRFHAMQSMLAFGAAFLAWATCWVGSFMILVVSATGFFLLQRLAQVVLLASFVVWAICLVQVVRGIDIRLPFFGPLADRLTRSGGEPGRPDPQG